MCVCAKIQDLLQEVKFICVHMSPFASWQFFVVVF